MPKSQMRVRSQVNALTMMSAMHCACLVVTAASRALLATPVVFTFSQTPPVTTVPPDPPAPVDPPVPPRIHRHPRRRGRPSPSIRPRRPRPPAPIDPPAPPRPPAPVPEDPPAPVPPGGWRQSPFALEQRLDVKLQLLPLALPEVGLDPLQLGGVDLQDLAPRLLAGQIGRLERSTPACRT